MISKLKNGTTLTGKFDWSFPKNPTPWADVTERDLEPQGPPELLRTVNNERQMVLKIHGEHVTEIGHLAIRCKGSDKDREIPQSLSIPDMPITFPLDQADGLA